VRGRPGHRCRRADRGDRRHGRAASRRVRAARHDQTRDRLHRRPDRTPGSPHGPRGRDHLRLERDGGREDGRVRARRYQRDEAPGGRRAAARGPAVNLRDVLRPEHIVVPLRAGTVKQATELLAARLVETGAVAEPNRLYAVIRNAWPEDLVSVGEHAFLPHFRTEAVRGLRTAVGIAPAPSGRSRRWARGRTSWSSTTCGVSPSWTMPARWSV